MVSGFQPFGVSLMTLFFFSIILMVKNNIEKLLAETLFPPPPKKMLIEFFSSGILFGRKICQVFFGWLDLSRDFFGCSKQSEDSW